MAAYEASIFKTLEEADSEIYEIFLNIAVEKLHAKQGGIRAPLFHPQDFFEREKPFWERLIHSVTEDDERIRFSGWAPFTVPLKELNADLAKKNIFPEGVDLSDFNAFITLRERKAILNYLLGDANRCRITTSAVQAQLKSVEKFCEKYELDIDILKNYEQLAHIFGAESSQKNKDSFAVITSSSIEISEEMHHQKKGFVTCQQVLFLDVLKLEEAREALDKKIDEFCVENGLDKKAIMDLAEKKKHDGSGRLGEVITLAGEALALDAKIEAYKTEIETVKRSLILLRHSEDYEKIVTHLKNNFGISSTFFAEKVIAICGHGLKHPYRLPLTEREYIAFLEKKLNTKLIEIKNALYYRTAERKIFAIQNQPAPNPLEQLRNHLSYIMQVIELGSYETSIFNSEKIDYSISVEKGIKVVETLRKQKPIPDFLYHYYVQLQEIISKLDFEQEPLGVNSAPYLAIIRLKLMPQENDVHYQWHYKFLNQLQNMVQEKRVASLLAAPAISSPPSSFSSSSPVSFHANKRISPSGTSEPMSSDSSSPRFE